MRWRRNEVEEEEGGGIWTGGGVTGRGVTKEK